MVLLISGWRVRHWPVPRRQWYLALLYYTPVLHIPGVLRQRRGHCLRLHCNGRHEARSDILQVCRRCKPAQRQSGHHKQSAPIGRATGRGSTDQQSEPVHLASQTAAVPKAPKQEGAAASHLEGQVCLQAKSQGSKWASMRRLSAVAASTVSRLPCTDTHRCGVAPAAAVAIAAPPPQLLQRPSGQACRHQLAAAQGAVAVSPPSRLG